MTENTASEEVYLSLKKRIINGEFLPGVHLVEGDLAKDYPYSRVTIREALRRLVEDELVELLPHRGIHVRKISLRELKDLYLIMEYLTGLAARLAAESSDINTIRDLEKIYKEMVVSVENEDFDYKVELTLRFHRRILKDTGNNYLIRMVERTQLISSLHYEVMPLKQRMKASLESHRKILDAIIARDADQAEDLMRLHYRSAINLISDSFQKSEPVPVSYPAT